MRPDFHATALNTLPRWWKGRGGGKCDDQKSQADTANELTLDSVGGVFVVLIAGMGVACTISVMEFVWKSASLEKKCKVKSLHKMCFQNKKSNSIIIGY